MKIADVRKNAFAMPLNDPAYPRPPYKFYNREFIVISYRTDPERLRSVVPEPLEPRTVRNSPSWISREILSTATKSP